MKRSDLNGANEVTIGSLYADEDELMGWRRSVAAGTQGRVVAPIQTAAGPMPNSSVPLGAAPKVGDLLRNINFFIFDAANADVYLEDGLATDTTGGLTGTAPSGTDTLTLTATVAPAVAVNALAGCVLWITYTPTGAGVPIKVMKTIKSHIASSGTTFTPVLLDAIPAGATITGWGVRPRDAAWQIRKKDQDGREFNFGQQATKAEGYRLSVGSGVVAFPGGQFTW